MDYSLLLIVYEKKEQEEVDKREEEGDFMQISQKVGDSFFYKQPASPFLQSNGGPKESILELKECPRGTNPLIAEEDPYFYQ